MFSGCFAHAEDGNISFWELNILTGLQCLGVKVISLRYKLGRKGTTSEGLYLQLEINFPGFTLKAEYWGYFPSALSCPRPQSMVLPLY